MVSQRGEQFSTFKCFIFTSDWQSWKITKLQIKHKGGHKETCHKKVSSTDDGIRIGLHRSEEKKIQSPKVHFRNMPFYLNAKLHVLHSYLCNCALLFISTVRQRLFLFFIVAILLPLSFMYTSLLFHSFLVPRIFRLHPLLVSGCIQCT